MMKVSQFQPRFEPLTILLMSDTRYKFDTSFEREIKREVFKVVNRGQEFGTNGWYFRAVCYLLVFLYLKYLWAIGPTTSWLLAVAYGVSGALVGLNVQHDANHGACSKRHPWINELLGFSVDAVGCNKWLWQQQHWTVRSIIVCLCGCVSSSTRDDIHN
jgi:fatty acid desaturase (delta-4 desaturase)